MYLLRVKIRYRLIARNYKLAQRALSLLLSNYLMEEYEDEFSAKELDKIAYYTFCIILYTHPTGTTCKEISKYAQVIDDLLELIDERISLTKIDKYLSAILLYKVPSQDYWFKKTNYNPLNLTPEEITRSLHKQANQFFKDLFKTERKVSKKNHNNRIDTTIFDISLSSVAALTAIISITIFVSCYIFGNTFLSAFGIEASNHLSIQDYLSNFSWHILLKCLISVFVCGASYYFAVTTKCAEYQTTPQHILLRRATPWEVKALFVMATLGAVQHILIAEKLFDNTFNGGLILLTLIFFGKFLDKMSVYFKETLHSFILILLFLMATTYSYFEALNYHHTIVQKKVPSMSYTFLNDKVKTTQTFIPLASSDFELILYSPESSDVVVLQRRRLISSMPTIRPQNTYDNPLRKLVINKISTVFSPTSKDKDEHSILAKNLPD